MINFFLTHTHDWGFWSWACFAGAVFFYVKASANAVKMWIKMMAGSSEKWIHWPLTRVALFFFWPLVMLFGMLVSGYRLLFRGRVA